MFTNVSSGFDNLSELVTLNVSFSRKFSFHVVNFEVVLYSILDGKETQNILSPQVLHGGPSGDTKRSTRQIKEARLPVNY